VAPHDAKLGYHAVLVLSAFAAGARYGLEAMDRTGLSSGTVYPVLRRLESAGLLHARWEDAAQAHGHGRPARRYYTVTARGRAALAKAREQIHARQRALGWVEGGGAGD
jgi:PadR family transcriptional regulator